MNKPYLVGIAGGSASGKSTFCEKLEKSLGMPNIKSLHMDRYFKPKNERPFVKAFVTGIKYTDDNHPLTVDHDKLMADLKQLLEEGHDIIIVEGLLTLWYDDLYSMLDLKLFMECESDERLARRIKRNIQRGLSMEEITSVYLDMVRFRYNEYVEPSKWRADIIINGSKPSDTSLNVISEYIINNYKKERKE